MIPIPLGNAKKASAPPSRVIAVPRLSPIAVTCRTPAFFSAALTSSVRSRSYSAPNRTKLQPVSRFSLTSVEAHSAVFHKAQPSVTKRSLSRLET